MKALNPLLRVVTFLTAFQTSKSEQNFSKTRISHRPIDLKEKVDQWLNLCKNEGSSRNEIMEWTVLSKSLHYFAGLQSNLNYNETKPVCASTEDTILSIGMFAKDYGCQIPWLNSVDICRVQQKFSHIIWSGDSLTRHMTGGLYMLQSGNYYQGVHPPAASALFENFDVCICDNQFSEYVHCRNKTASHGYTYESQISRGYCSNLTDFKSFMFTHVEKDATYEGYWLCNADPRPKFVFLQGGVHFWFDADSTIKHYLRPALEYIDEKQRGCFYDVSNLIYVAYSGATYSADSVAAKYPYQSTAHVKNFTEKIELFLKTEYPRVLIVDFFNVSYDAILNNRSSDGFHMLSDVNVIKAMTVINLMNIIGDTPYNSTIRYMEGMAVAKELGVREGDPVRHMSGKQIFLFRDGSLRRINDFKQFVSLGLDTNNVKVFRQIDFNKFQFGLRLPP